MRFYRRFVDAAIKEADSAIKTAWRARRADRAEYSTTSPNRPLDEQRFAPFFAALRPRSTELATHRAYLLHADYHENRSRAFWKCGGLGGP